jgi:hypothetical protein
MSLEIAITTLVTFLKIRKMLNFYEFYNKTGLDKEEYRDKIVRVKNFKFDDAGSIAHIIKRTPLYAVGYTLGIGKRWMEAEPLIMLDYWYALQYARDVIKKRWPEVGPFLSSNVVYGQLYCQEFRI